MSLAVNLRSGIGFEKAFFISLLLLDTADGLKYTAHYEKIKLPPHTRINEDQTCGSSIRDCEFSEPFDTGHQIEVPL